MDQKTFAKLVSKAQEDPEFFHRLTFTPEKAIDELKDDVPRSVLGSLVGKEPAEMVARTLGVLGYCGNTCSSSCGNTCTGSSCGYTTNLVGEVGSAVKTPYFVRGVNELAYCGNTCSSSCGNTCNASCGYTTNLVDEFDMRSQFRFNQVFR